ncbi:MAG: hypothetical protein WBF17_06135, partial [Phycisphaerae bacterium]
MVSSYRLRRLSGRRIALLAVLFPCLAAPPAGAVTSWDPVNEVSQSQYQTYQVTVQDMGLGLYAGPAYDQGYRNRYNAGG